MRLLVVSQTLLLVASVMIAGPVAAVKPSPSPSATPAPTAEPTLAPTPEPTPAPTAEPTAEPTPAPTRSPPRRRLASRQPIRRSTRPSSRAPIRRRRQANCRSRARRRAPVRIRARSRQSPVIHQPRSLRLLSAHSISTATDDLVRRGSPRALPTTSRLSCGSSLKARVWCHHRHWSASLQPFLSLPRAAGQWRYHGQPEHELLLWDRRVDRHARCRLRRHDGRRQPPVRRTTIVTSNVWHHAAAPHTTGSTWNLYPTGALEGTLAVEVPSRSPAVSSTLELPRPRRRRVSRGPPASLMELSTMPEFGTSPAARPRSRPTRTPSSPRGLASSAAGA